MLLDSNIVIYAARPEHEALRRFIRDYASAVSVVTLIEVLGYHRLRDSERSYLGQFFEASVVLPLSDAVVRVAIQLRQRHTISLGDSVVAATALHHGLPLVTHNVGDFDWIAELDVRDPLEEARG